MGWLEIGKLVAQGIGAAASTTSAIAGAVNAAEANKQQEKALAEQKRQADLAQQNLKDSQAKQDKAEQNAINSASDFMGKKDEEQEQEGDALNGSLSNYISPMERE